MALRLLVQTFAGVDAESVGPDTGADADVSPETGS